MGCSGGRSDRPTGSWPRASKRGSGPALQHSAVGAQSPLQLLANGGHAGFTEVALHHPDNVLVSRLQPLLEIGSCIARSGGGGNAPAVTQSLAQDFETACAALAGRRPRTCGAV